MRKDDEDEDVVFWTDDDKRTQNLYEPCCCEDLSAWRRVPSLLTDRYLEQRSELTGRVRIELTRNIVVNQYAEFQEVKSVFGHGMSPDKR